MRGTTAAGKLDLRGGTSVWEAWQSSSIAANRLEDSQRCRILIIGSGITGSFLAERLSRGEHSIIVVDRHRPQSASTAASTSLLQWELDTPLSALTARLGVVRAADIYRASALAVREIVDLSRKYAIACHCAERPSLYLSGSRLGPDELKDEHRQREAAGLPSNYVSAGDIKRSFGLTVEAALYSGGAAEANPVALARGLMNVARARGVRIFHPETVTAYDRGPRGVTVLTESGHELAADFLILANGYEMPDFVPSRIHRVVSTWALATELGMPLWPQHALLWEASSPYLYARHNAQGRIILGGEDEDLNDPGLRDEKIVSKIGTIRRKFRRVFPPFSGRAEFAWAGFFGTTSDGLPLIGPVEGSRHVYAAFGYGGNGITFSAMAARLIDDAIHGRTDPLLESFAVERE